MLQRLVYIERFAVLGSCALAPLLACLWIYKANANLTEAAAILVAFILAMGFIGGAAGLLCHRILALGSVQWGGHEETAALIKLAIGELIGGKADKKLNDAAMTQANAQEGRATSIYVFQRALQLRQRGSLSAGEKNPISGFKRSYWASLVLLLGAGTVLAPVLIPDIDIRSNYSLLCILMLMPVWLTGIAVSGLGLSNADSWLTKLRFKSDKQPKLRPRSSKSTAGQWHKKDSRSDIPVFKIILLAPIVIAASLYLLREFGPDLSSSSVQFDNDFADQSTPDPLPERPAARTAQPALATQRSTAPSEPTASAQTEQSSQAQQAVTSWPDIPPKGAVLLTDQDTLTYAGWDLSSVSTSLDQAKQRIDTWYASHWRDNPKTIGRVSLRMTLQPRGSISNIQLLAAEFNDPSFINGLRDRLEAVAMPAGAIDPVPVVLSMDFRP